MDVNSFLDSIHWFRDPAQLPELEADFIAHMKKGLAGENSSLPMIPTYLHAGDIPEGEHTVIVLDAGGTNLRTFLVNMLPGREPKVLYSHKRPMPGKETPLEKDAFFDAIAAEVLPIAAKTERIGFCFSFPCVIHPDYDGEILYMDKEITVHGIEGAMVGAQLNLALSRLGYRGKAHRVIVLNDTVAALLGTLAQHPASDYSGYIGMILGTGMNCCYQEQNRNILKNDLLRGRSGASIINMEAGNYYGYLPLSDADVRLSRHAKEAGKNLTEKMMSGAYQGGLMHSLLLCAADGGLLSAPMKEKLLALPGTIQTVDVSLYTSVPAAAGVLHDLCVTREDGQVLWALADAVLDRAALLTTMILTAIMVHTDTGRDPVYPVTITIEGTTFEREARLKEKIHAFLVNNTEKQRGIHFRVYQTADANMVGAAAAAVLAE